MPRMKQKVQKVGKPPKLKMTENKLLQKVEEYIQSCSGKGEYPNIAGLCIYLDIGRSTYYDTRREYPYTFEKIDTLLENAAINSKGASDTLKIFYMKNKCGYADKIQSEIKASVTIEDFFKENEINF